MTKKEFTEELMKERGMKEYDTDPIKQYYGERLTKNMRKQRNKK